VLRILQGVQLCHSVTRKALIPMFWELQGRENVSFLNKESEKRLIIK